MTFFIPKLSLIRGEKVKKVVLFSLAVMVENFSFSSEGIFESDTSPKSSLDIVS